MVEKVMTEKEALVADLHSAMDQTTKALSRSEYLEGVLDNYRNHNSELAGKLYDARSSASYWEARYKVWRGFGMGCIGVAMIGSLILWSVLSNLKCHF